MAWGVPACCRNGKVRELRASEAQASEQVGRVKRGELKIAVQPEQQALDSLRQQLPGQPQASELIERLYRLASAERISLARGEYALGIDPRPSWRATRSCCQCAAATRRSRLYQGPAQATADAGAGRPGAATQTHRRQRAQCPPAHDPLPVEVMMNTQRAVIWAGFLGVSAALAWAPDHWFGQYDGVAAFAVNPRLQQKRCAMVGAGLPAKGPEQAAMTCSQPSNGRHPKPWPRSPNNRL
jgi:hypothetical protein